MIKDFQSGLIYGMEVLCFAPRIQNLVNAQVSCVSKDFSTISILDFKTSGQDVLSTIQVHECLVQYLRTWIERVRPCLHPKVDSLFLNPQGGAMDWRGDLIRRSFKAFSLEATGTALNPHSVRNSLWTNLVSRGDFTTKELQEIAKSMQSSPQTLNRWYFQASMENFSQLAGNLTEIFDPDHLQKQHEALGKGMSKKPLFKSANLPRGWYLQSFFFFFSTLHLFLLVMQKTKKKDNFDFSFYLESPKKRRKIGHREIISFYPFTFLLSEFGKYQILCTFVFFCFFF